MSRLLLGIPEVGFPPAFAEPMGYVRTDYRALIRRNRKMATAEEKAATKEEKEAIAQQEHEAKQAAKHQCPHCKGLTIWPDPRRTHKCARCRRNRL